MANLVPVAQTFLPEVFERFPQIDTFDVCQEPPPGVDDRAEPRTWTQVLLSRQQASTVGWDHWTWGVWSACCWTILLDLGRLVSVLLDHSAERQCLGRDREDAGVGCR